MTEGSNKNTPCMAPGLIRDKVAERFAALNPSIRTTPLSGQDLRDPIGRTLLKEAHGLYTQWQQQDTEGILRKSADTLEIILTGLKQHGLDQTDLLQTREERLNMSQSLIPYLSDNPASGLFGCGNPLNSIRYLFKGSPLKGHIANTRMDTGKPNDKKCIFLKKAQTL